MDADTASLELTEETKAETAAIVDGIVERGARILLLEPERMERILPGISTMPRREGFRRAAGVARYQAQQLRRGHWAADANHVLALRQLRLAVGILLLRERAQAARRNIRVAA